MLPVPWYTDRHARLRPRIYTPVRSRLYIELEGLSFPTRRFVPMWEWASAPAAECLVESLSVFIWICSSPSKLVRQSEDVLRALYMIIT